MAKAAVAGRGRPRATVAVFNDTSANRHYGCDAVMASLVAHLQRHELHPAMFWPVAEDWRAARQQIAARRFDAIVVNAEGTVHGDAVRPRAAALLELSDFARAIGRPAFLINATIHALSAAGLERLRRFDAVFVRERRSQALLAEAGIPAGYAPDLSVTSPHDAAALTGRKGVLFTDSVLHEATGALRRAARATGARFIPMKRPRSALERVRRLAGFPAAHRAGFARSVHPTTDVAALLRLLQGAELVVTGRFHAVTLCLRTRTPFLALASNTPKIEATCCDALGSSERVFGDVAALSAELQTRISRWQHFDETEAGALSAYLGTAQDRTDQMMRAIAGQIADRSDRAGSLR